MIPLFRRLPPPGWPAARPQAGRLARAPWINVALLGLLLLFATDPLVPVRPRMAPAEATAAFGAACEGMVVYHLERARTEVLVAAYSLTRRSIVTALSDARRRGVEVRVKYDARQAQFEGMERALEGLRRDKIECRAVRMGNGERAAMHHKFIVVDREVVVTGSYNFTTTASRDNYENLVALDAPAVAARFAAEFEAIRSR